MTTTPDTQEFRRARLRELVDTHHRGRCGDYDDQYEGFALTYGLKDADEDHDWKDEVEVPDEPQPIPRYASVAGDETYGMIQLCETLAEAISDQAGIPSNGEYLNVPQGVYDLDTGKGVPYRLVGLSEEAYAVLCGLVQPSWMQANTPEQEAEAVNQGGIYTDCWDELRATFPLEQFRKAAEERGEDFYNEEAGL